MNKGIPPGLNADGWRRYRPRLLLVGNGGETQPDLGDAGITTQRDVPFGRYLIVDKQFVVVETQHAFVGVSSPGIGAVYVVSLPFPARRWTGIGSASYVPIGTGMCYWSIGEPNVNLPVAVTLADPYLSLAGQEDGYVQCYCPYIVSWGTATWPGTNTTVTVTHQCGYAPRAEDIDIVITSALGSGANPPPTVQNITTTTFDAVLRSNPGSQAFSWKVRGKPPAQNLATPHGGPMMGPSTPFDWSRETSLGPFGNIFLQMKYEARL